MSLNNVLKMSLLPFLKSFCSTFQPMLIPEFSSDSRVWWFVCREVKEWGYDQQHRIQAEPPTPSSLLQLVHDVTAEGEIQTELAVLKNRLWPPCGGVTVCYPSSEAKTLLNWMQVGGGRGTKHRPCIPRTYMSCFSSHGKQAPHMFCMTVRIMWDYKQPRLPLPAPAMSIFQENMLGA